jgi:hypothetical protein
MTHARAHSFLCLALTATACGAAGGGRDQSPKRDAAAMDAAGAVDGGARKDGGGPEATPPNVFGDAPVFNWDGGGGGTGGSGSGGSMGGAGGRGGSGGGGGTPAPDAPTAPDAPWMPIDAHPVVDFGLPGETAPRVDASPPVDGGSRADGASDLVADGGAPDTTGSCSARIVSVIPALLRDEQSLVAAPNIKVVLRAEVVSGPPPGLLVPWTWSGRWNGTPITPQSDPLRATDVAFSIEREGDYVFYATAGNCAATFTRSARGPGGCSACDYGTDVQVVPPPDYGLPKQAGFVGYAQGISLAGSYPVTLVAQVGSRMVPSYVRINTPDGVLVTDGYADPSLGFSRPLLMLAGNGDVARYQVLVVPMDGDGTTAATAPQLFSDRTVVDLGQDGSLDLSGGVRISGTTLGPDGQAQADVRIMLSNQDPAAATAPTALIFSSVGRTNAQGSFALNAQPGRYWVSIFPTTDSALWDAIDPLPITVAGEGTLAFQWRTPVVAPLTLQVVDGVGQPAANTRVLLRARALPPVGTLAYQSSGAAGIAHEVRGNLEVEVTTDARGAVTLASLPADATFDVQLVPAVPGPAAAPAEFSLTIPAGGLTQTLALASEGYIYGTLVSGDASLAPDWTRVQVVGFDKSAVAAEAPRTVAVGPDGNFALAATPGRPYVVLAWPDPSTGLARTFVGPGLMQATGVRFLQKVQASMAWSANVTLSTNSQVVGIVGAALQATCHPGYWRCVDPTIPLAETTTVADGAFTLAVPNPATR